MACGVAAGSLACWAARQGWLLSDLLGGLRWLAGQLAEGHVEGPGWQAVALASTKSHPVLW